MGERLGHRPTHRGARDEVAHVGERPVGACLRIERISASRAMPSTSWTQVRHRRSPTMTVVGASSTTYSGSLRFTSSGRIGTPCSTGVVQDQSARVHPRVVGQHAGQEVRRVCAFSQATDRSAPRTRRRGPCRSRTRRTARPRARPARRPRRSHATADRPLDEVDLEARQHLGRRRGGVGCGRPRSRS